MNVWRLHTRDNSEKNDRFEYCIKNNLAIVGWCRCNDKIPLEERINISKNVNENFDAYYKELQDRYHDKKKGLTALYRFRNVEVGDLIWIRGKGKYYIGRVSENTKFIYDYNDKVYEHDFSHQLTEIKWLCFEEGDESTVPGAIANSFIKGWTFQRINKSGILEYSQLLYNMLSKKEYYSTKLELSKDTFYSLLTPSDCEDLLCLWLYAKKGYICIPSTNKISTPLYECVLKDPKNGKNIYIQVKQGNEKIKADEYRELDGEVWLFTTTRENIIDYDQEKYKNILIADPEELYEFALSKESDNILPKAINQWVRMLKCND